MSLSEYMEYDITQSVANSSAMAVTSALGSSEVDSSGGVPEDMREELLALVEILGPGIICALAGHGHRAILFAPWRARQRGRGPRTAQSGPASWCSGPVRRGR